MRVESRLSWLAVAAGTTLSASVAAVGADARWLAAIGAVIVRAGRIPSSIPYTAAPSHDWVDRKSTRLNSSHLVISYAVFCLKKKKQETLSILQKTILILIPAPIHNG